MVDPFAFVIEDSQISSSQEEILRRCPFLGEPVDSPDDGGPPTLPGTALGPGRDRGSQDLFLVPPEKQSSAFEFRPCRCHKGVQTDDDFTGYADAAVYFDLSDDPDAAVAGCSRVNDEDSSIEIFNCEIDKIQISRREWSPKDSIGESPHKRMKTSEQNPDFQSSEAGFGIEPQKIGDKLRTCEEKLVSDQKSPCNFGAEPRPQQNIQIGKEVPLGFAGNPVEKNLGSGKNLGCHVTQSEIATNTEECIENIEGRGRICEAEKLACSSRGNQTVNEIAETSEKKGGDERQNLRVLQPSMAACLKDIAERKNENGKSASFVFDVLKALTEETSQKDDLEDISFVELARFRDITFPTPYWWI